MGSVLATLGFGIFVFSSFVAKMLHQKDRRFYFPAKFQSAPGD
jgi:hypothetical protein